MSWIKKANKIGRYDSTYRGFRIYCTKEGEIKQETFEKEGELYRRTEFIKGWWVAIDRYGVRFEADNGESLAYKIDIEHLARHFDKHEK